MNEAKVTRFVKPFGAGESPSGKREKSLFVDSWGPSVALGSSIILALASMWSSSSSGPLLLECFFKRTPTQAPTNWKGAKATTTPGHHITQKYNHGCVKKAFSMEWHSDLGACGGKGKTA